MSGIYIHIPFCKQACHYCDFHFSTNLKNKGALVKAIITEIQLRKAYLPSKTLKSIYFGGGTPSLLESEELAAIMKAIGQEFEWEKDCEITLEANPDDVEPQRLEQWLRAGINRLSLGLQSFNDEELKWMNRAHAAKQNEESVKMAQKVGFNNITVDLIYGSKFQDLNSWKETVLRTLNLNVQHVSAYNLTIEGKTKLQHEQSKGLEPKVDDNLSAQQFEALVNILSTHGFEQYEISNFAKAGYIAKHNSNYWLQQPYLGIGPSAHSYNRHQRQWNVRSNTQYIQHIEKNEAFFELETLSENDKYNEYILTRLRTKWGIDVNDIEALFGNTFKQYFLKQALQNAAYFNQINQWYTLNEQGKLVADKISSDLFLL